MATAAGSPSTRPDGLPADVFDALRDALAAEAAAGGSGDDASDGDGRRRFAGVIEALRAAELRVEAWPLDGADWETVLAGVARAYARGRDAFAVARATPEPELLHAWRKRAKDLWYHQRLLAPAWPDVLGAQAEAAHALSELLGDDHDLAVLGGAARRRRARRSRRPSTPQRAELRALVDAPQRRAARRRRRSSAAASTPSRRRRSPAASRATSSLRSTRRAPARIDRALHG